MRPTQTELPHVRRSSEPVDHATAARRSAIIINALDAPGPAYYAQVADGFDAWANEESDPAKAAILRADAAAWRARAR